MRRRAKPWGLGSLSQLHYLTLNNNDFVGVIPTQLGNLANLRSLDLRRN